MEPFAGAAAFGALFEDAGAGGLTERAVFGDGTAFTGKPRVGLIIFPTAAFTGCLIFPAPLAAFTGCLTFLIALTAFAGLLIALAATRGDFLPGFRIGVAGRFKTFFFFAGDGRGAGFCGRRFGAAARCGRFFEAATRFFCVVLPFADWRDDLAVFTRTALFLALAAAINNLACQCSLE